MREYPVVTKRMASYLTKHIANQSRETALHTVCAAGCTVERTMEVRMLGTYYLMRTSWGEFFTLIWDGTTGYCVESTIFFED